MVNQVILKNSVSQMILAMNLVIKFTLRILVHLLILLNLVIVVNQLIPNNLVIMVNW